MAIIRGNGGIVKIGTVTVARVMKFSIDESMEPIESTDLVTDDKTFLPGDKSWTASVTCQWDAADTTGQGAMVLGAEVALHLIRDGDAATPADDVNGQALVIGIGSGNEKGSIVMQEFQLQGTGPLTK